MRRLTAILAAAVLLLFIPSSAPSSVAAAAGGCDIKASVGDGPLVDSALDIHLWEYFSVHGTGFPPSTTVTVALLGSTYDTTTDANGEFEMGGLYVYGIIFEPQWTSVSAYDPSNAATCTDSVSLRVLPAGWSPFTDIATNPFRTDIVWLWESGITSGCTATTFCPDNSVTRGQMAAFLVRALELPGTATDFFTDDETSMFEGDINRLAAAGITKGCTATTFCPGTTITREQMAAFLDRALQLPATAIDFFTDDGASMFEGSINRMAAAGITKGCTATTFCPLQTVTRGQMAAFLHRALD